MTNPGGFGPPTTKERSMRLQDIEAPAKPGFVFVECVWPETRGPKDDCRCATGIVWAGHGDVQEYPAALWWRLAAHPDVWRLVNPEAAAAAIAEAQERRRQQMLDEAMRAAGAAPQGGALTPATPPAATTTTPPSDGAATSAQAYNDAAAAAAAVAKEVGAQTNTDVVGVMTGPMTAEQLEALKDEEIKALTEQRGYPLHPRWGRKTLIARFLEAQESQAAGVDVGANGNTGAADNEGVDASAEG